MTWVIASEYMLENLSVIVCCKQVHNISWRMAKTTAHIYQGPRHIYFAVSLDCDNASTALANKKVCSGFLVADVVSRV